MYEGPVRCLKNSYVAAQVHIARTFLPFKVLYELHSHERFALLFLELEASTNKCQL